jgi:lactoylglutathione lyase
MITGAGSIAILVRDAQISAEWYRAKLGFEIVGNEGHAVFVKPKGASTSLLHLCGPCDAWGQDAPGGRTGIWFQCGEITFRKDAKTGQIVPASSPEDVERTYAELRRNGIEFSEELTTTDWGKYAIFSDPDGNEFEIS